MQIEPLRIDGAWSFTPTQHGDARGTFLEWFTDRSFGSATGRRFDLQQANCSVSAAGVLRGIHFADVPPGQAKYVFCPAGAVLDVVVDIRVGSATFGQWDAVVLDDTDRRALYIGEGLGHAFMSLDDASTLVYLCSAPYRPDHEHGVNPLDPALGIEWPESDRRGRPITPVLSERDAAAPDLTAARDSGLLPTYASVTEYVDGLRSQS